MSQLGCRCGERMAKTDCPSPCSLEIFYKFEVERAVERDPSIKLLDFLSGWDEKNDCLREYKMRPEPVDYWFCPACGRIYEVQYIPGGRWLRIYNRVDALINVDMENWTRIYVMLDTETDVATEKVWDLKLADYLQQYDTIHHYISPEETMVSAVDKETSEILYSYVLEDSWAPFTGG